MRKIFHGSADVEAGKLVGTTDTDYFYFLCPKCNNAEVLQLLDFKIIRNGPVLSIYNAPQDRVKVERDFIIGFELHCLACKFHDFVKVANVGWQGGNMKNHPIERIPLAHMLPLAAKD